MTEPRSSMQGHYKKTPRKRRMSPQSIFILLLVLMAVILVLIGILSAARQRKADPSEIIPPGESKTITISAVGDICMNQGQLDDAQQADGSYDFSPAFLNVAPLLSQSDYTIGNLECNLAGAPYSGNNGNAPDSLATALAGSGFDLLQTANSYSIQNGLDGLSATITAIENAGMVSTGTYASKESRRESKGVLVQEIAGVRVAFVAFTKGMNNMSLPEGAEYAVNLLFQDYASNYSQIDRDAICDVMEQANDTNPDLIIALLHWGSEDDSAVSDRQHEIADLLLENGADVILGTHSHRVGPFETREVTRDGETKKCFIAYSLGNFYTGDTGLRRQASVVLNLSFTKDGSSGETTLAAIDYTPIFCVDYGKEVSNRYQIVESEKALSLYEADYAHSVPEDTYESIRQSIDVLKEAIGTDYEAS